MKKRIVVSVKTKFDTLQRLERGEYYMLIELWGAAINNCQKKNTKFTILGLNYFICDQESSIHLRERQARNHKTWKVGRVYERKVSLQSSDPH